MHWIFDRALDGLCWIAEKAIYCILRIYDIIAILFKCIWKWTVFVTTCSFYRRRRAERRDVELATGSS